MDFMEKHHDIARGYVKGDKVIVESLWSKLTKLLNSSGPPSKTCKEWKKTWSDWKANVKKKMCHNKKEMTKTGGGENNEFVFTAHEESLIRICGFHKTVDGIPGAMSFGEFASQFDLSDSENENEDIQSTSKRAYSRAPAQKRPRSITPTSKSPHSHKSLSKRSRSRSLSSTSSSSGSSSAIEHDDAPSKQDQSRPPSTLKRAPSRTTSKSVPLRTPRSNELDHSDSETESELDVNPSTSKNALSRMSNTKNKRSSAPSAINRGPSRASISNRSRPSTPIKPDLNVLLAEENSHLQNLEEILKILKEQRDEMKKQNEKLDRLCDILENKYKDDQLNNIEMRKIMCEKNELKLKLIEIETIKLSLEQEKAKQN